MKTTQVRADELRLLVVDRTDNDTVRLAGTAISVGALTLLFLLDDRDRCALLEERVRAHKDAEAAWEEYAIIKTEFCRDRYTDMPIRVDYFVHDEKATELRAAVDAALAALREACK